MGCDNSGCRLSPSQFRFDFRIFSEGENWWSTITCKKLYVIKMFVDLLVLSIFLMLHLVRQAYRELMP